MHRYGHYGTALIVYAPLLAVLLSIGYRGMAILGGVLMISGAMVPDFDMRVPFLTHRGFTHTVWFALLFGALVGVAFVALGQLRGIVVSVQYGVFGAIVGTLTILAHVLADALTPMGVRPFRPLADTSYSLGITTAANVIANNILLGLGLVATLLAFVVGIDLAAALPGFVDRW